MTLQQPKRIGLALGGGGTRGIAHVGVLKALEREGIGVNCIAGTSVGGLIAAMNAHGLMAKDIQAEMTQLGRFRQYVSLFDVFPPPIGPIKGKQFHDYLVNLFGPDCTFDDLQRPVTVTAVDLVAGDLVLLNEGRVADAVRATVAIPGLVAPVNMDGRLLVDGGVLNNVPADIVRVMGADVVIAVDVGIWHTLKNNNGDPRTSQRVRKSIVPSAARQGWRALSIMMAQQVAQRLRECPPDLIIRPDIPAEIVLFAGLQRTAELVAAGEEAMMRALPELRKAMEG